jgi:hypothetical protein
VSCHLIRDNLERDSNITEESDLQQEKQFILKTSTNAGIVINLRPLFMNAFDAIPSNFDTFSITTDSMDSFLQTLSDEINFIGEGSHSLWLKK